MQYVIRVIGREVEDPDGEFVNVRVLIENSTDFKTTANFAIADGTPERKFLRALTQRNNATRLDAWLKNTPVGFYFIEYAWKKGSTPKAANSARIPLSAERPGVCC